MSWIGTVKALSTPIIRMRTYIGPFLKDRARLWHILGVCIFNGYLKSATWVAKILGTAHCDDDGCMRTQNIPHRLMCSSNNLTIDSAAEEVAYLPASERMRRNIEAADFWRDVGENFAYIPSGFSDTTRRVETLLIVSSWLVRRDARRNSSLLLCQGGTCSLN